MLLIARFAHGWNLILRLTGLRFDSLEQNFVLSCLKFAYLTVFLWVVYLWFALKVMITKLLVAPSFDALPPALDFVITAPVANSRLHAVWLTTTFIGMPLANFLECRIFLINFICLFVILAHLLFSLVYG